MKPDLRFSVLAYSLTLFVVLNIISKATAQSSYLDRVIVRTRTISSGGGNYNYNLNYDPSVRSVGTFVKENRDWKYLRRGRTSKDKDGLVVFLINYFFGINIKL
jgi:hypothetical protein